MYYLNYYLELAAYFCLIEDFSLAALKLQALFRSLLKLLDLMRAGLSMWGLRRVEESGVGEWVRRG